MNSNVCINSSVRQSVLYCMCCLLSSVPGSTLPLLLEKGLDEMMLWMKGKFKHIKSYNITLQEYIV